jgi:hypothetical protein
LVDLQPVIADFPLHSRAGRATMNVSTSLMRSTVLDSEQQ